MKPQAERTSRISAMKERAIKMSAIKSHRQAIKAAGSGAPA
jgi:hypothetical protein